MPTMTSARLLNDVLALSPEERREFALRVLETVDHPTPPDIEEAQVQEVIRRSRLIRSGLADTVASEEVEAELAAIVRGAP